VESKGNLVETSCGPATKQNSLQHQVNVKISLREQLTVALTFMELEYSLHFPQNLIVWPHACPVLSKTYSSNENLSKCFKHKSQKVYGRRRIWFVVFLTSALDEDEYPVPCSWERDHGTHWTGGCVGIMTGLNDCPNRETNHNSSDVKSAEQSLHQMRQSHSTSLKHPFKYYPFIYGQFFNMVFLLEVFQPYAFLILPCVPHAPNISPFLIWPL
jgi:hypothetical protein